MPGISKEDVKIDLQDNQLMVSGERKHERERTEGRRMNVERVHGAFQRLFTLPAKVDSDHIEANFENGVLQIVVPKTEAAQTKPIQIKEHKGGIFGKLLGREKEVKSGKPEKGEKAA